MFSLWLKEVPDFAVIFCQLLLIRNLIEQLFKTLASSISAQGKIKNYQITSSILCYFPLICSYYLFSIGFPAHTLYIVFILYSIIASCIILYFAKRNFNFPVNIFLKEVIFKCLAVFTFIYLMAYIPYCLLEQGLIRLSLVTLTSSISYAIFIWFIGFSIKEREQLTFLISPFVNKFYTFSLNNKKRK